MRLTTRAGLALAAAAAAALAAAGWAGMAASQQSTCAASDTNCRLTQIEASLARIERALASGGGGGGGGGQVSMAANQTCDSDALCRRAATNLCVNAGFQRGVPADLRPIEGYSYRMILVSVTCLD